MIHHQRKLELLRQVVFLADFPESLLDALAEALQPLACPPQTLILSMGEVSHCMYFILRGRVRIHKGDFDVAELGEGEVFGEFSLIDAEPRSASVSSITEVELYRLTRDDFFSVLSRDASLFEAIMRQLVGRMRQMTRTQIIELEHREEVLQVLVEQRTAQLRIANEDLSQANEEILFRQAALENAIEELRSTNEKLNQKSVELNTQKKLIEEKNALLEENNILLRESLETIKRQQEHMIQSEKMAALGMLAPVVAHEINTPTGAVKGAVQNLHEMLPHVFEAVRRCMLAIAEARQSELYDLIDHLTSHSEPISSREERRLIREMEDLLNEAGFPHAEENAARLVRAGVVKHLDELLPWLADESIAEAVLQLAVEVGRMRRQFLTIDQSAERVRRIVTSLTNYVHRRPESSKPTPTDLPANVDIVLSLYEYYFRQGVELVREYDDVPLVPGFPENLIQVWTNILMNALHAVKSNAPDRRPVIKINIAVKEDWIEVRISNNGPPIADGVVERIFEPLFTTKAKEEGTGLGLSISAKIVEQHAGLISVSSDEEWTSFSVLLPAK